MSKRPRPHGPCICGHAEIDHVGHSCRRCPCTRYSEDDRKYESQIADLEFPAPEGP